MYIMHYYYNAFNLKFFSYYSFLVANLIHKKSQALMFKKNANSIIDQRPKPSYYPAANNKV
ncbi:hypothetical protein CV667_04685 [Borreliella burgdorferi]|nr:hypothetical protein CV667_04685 [Borreliella burgdorferi]PRR18376.1 hypothetical protein CV654_04860 [Borreliella burgdorferi]PRR47174.1 hypothetical protein CV662_04695 [Borreliella burgdorferi]PRR58043.1 hypothetical protein CV648_04860 [Borreliella burgdorferi]PRR66526.1 hypothetical protein CV637_04695 [Borreliella burgdorferi]